jgi:hypothetical protein
VPEKGVLDLVKTELIEELAQDQLRTQQANILDALEDHLEPIVILLWKRK